MIGVRLRGTWQRSLPTATGPQEPDPLINPYLTGAPMMAFSASDDPQPSQLWSAVEPRVPLGQMSAKVSD